MLRAVRGDGGCPRPPQGTRRWVTSPCEASGVKDRSQALLSMSSQTSEKTRGMPGPAFLVSPPLGLLSSHSAGF